MRKRSAFEVFFLLTSALITTIYLSVDNDDLINLILTLYIIFIPSSVLMNIHYVFKNLDNVEKGLMIFFLGLIFYFSTIIFTKNILPMDWGQLISFFISPIIFLLILVKPMKINEDKNNIFNNIIIEFKNMKKLEKLGKPLNF